MSLPKNNSLVYKISRIKDASLSSFVYSLVEIEWDTFFQKNIVGLSRDTDGKKGEAIAEAIVDNVDFLARKLKTYKIDYDIVYALAYVFPCYIGSRLSVTEVDGWQYVKKHDLWRDPDFKQYIHDWQDIVAGRMDMFRVEKRKKRLILRAMDMMDDTQELESIIYRVAYTYSVNRRR